MRCIYCQTNANYNARQSYQGCLQCGHKFAFEPKVDNFKLTDPFFSAACEKVSYHNILFYSQNHLWYELNKRLFRRRQIDPIAVIIFLFIFLFLLLSVVQPNLEGGLLLLILGAGVIIGGALGLHYYQKSVADKHIVMPHSYFMNIVMRKWKAAHGLPEKMLDFSERPSVSIEPRGDERDLLDYSVDRLLVTDRTETAVMLIANNVHFDKKCAIISAEEMDHEHSQLILKMVEKNPNVQVFAIHDASITGCMLPHTLRQESWIQAGTVPVFDIGLRPHHVKRIRLITRKYETIPSKKLKELIDHLTTEEMKWLAEGNVAELEAIRPRRLMRIIGKAFAQADDPTLDKNTTEDGEIWGYDDSDDIFWMESFG